MAWLQLPLLTLTAALLSAQSAPAPTAAGRALTIDDYYQLKSVGAPKMSPDGKWVAYTVATRIEATNTDPTEVWLAAADGRSAPRRISVDGTDAAAPSWVDGVVEFRVGTRRHRVNPSQPEAILDAPAAAATTPGEQRIPAPAGGAVALLRDIAPPPRAADTRTDFERRHDDRFQGRQFDWLNFQRDGQRYPVPDRTNPRVAPTQELWITSGGSAPRQLTRLGLRPQGVSWNATGSALVFTADSGYRDERRYPAAAVYVVTAAGSITRLTPEPDIDHEAASFSPDGQWVLYTRQLSTNAVIAQKLDHNGPTDLAIRPVSGGAERVLTAEWDLLPENATFSADGRYVYFSGGIAGAQHLFRVPVAGGAVEQVTRGARRLAGLSFDTRFTRIAYTATTTDSAAEVYVADIDGTNERRLSDVNAELRRDVAFSRAERLQFTSADGTPIEGWLTYPHGYRADRRYPLVVSNHGGPHSADGYAFDFKTQYLAANGYFVLKVNFRSSTGYGEKFLWATWGAWGTKDGQDVMAGVDAALARAPIDRARVATMGHSYGGFMTNWLITQYPDRFAAAIPGAGIVNWVSDYGTADIAVTKETEFFGTPWEDKAREIMMRQSPLTYAGRVKAPTLFIHGEIDERVPYSEAEQMFVALKKNGVPAAIIQYKDMPHSISGSWNQVHRMLHERQWLDQWLKPPAVAPRG
jgi:dipeptidyl aminopeptidase/acylaminoacyl peptidase